MSVPTPAQKEKGVPTPAQKERGVQTPAQKERGVPTPAQVPRLIAEAQYAKPIPVSPIALPTEAITVFGALKPEQAPKEAKGYIPKAVRKIEPESPQIFDILEFDLGVARDGNEPIPIIWDRILILRRDGTVYFKKSDTEKWLDLTLVRYIDITPHAESKFFLKNSAQAGKTLILIVGRLASMFIEPSFGGAILITDSSYNIIEPISRASTPVIYNVTCTVANTEYSQALPSNCKKFMIRARGGDLRICFTSGQSGTTYLTIQQNGAYSEDLIQPAALTLYFQSPSAGAVAEIIAWS